VITRSNRRDRNKWYTQPRDVNTGHWARRKREQPRRYYLHLRVSDAERSLIEQAAADAGTTVTAWILAAAVRAAGSNQTET